MRVLTGAIIVLVAAAWSLPAQGQVPRIQVMVDGQPVVFDQPPVMMQGRVMVPLRGVFERLGASVVWDDASRTVVAVRGDTAVELQIGRLWARVNNRTIPLEVPALVMGGRTLVPLRFVSEALGAVVEWREAARTVVIIAPQPPTAPPAAAPPPPAPAPARPAPPAQPRSVTLAGVIREVQTAPSPSILLARGSTAHRLTITPETAISRVDLSTNTGGTIAVAGLAPGDDAEVQVGDNNVALRIRATYRSAAGRIDTVAAGGQTIVLSGGQTFRVNDQARVLINDQPHGTADLRRGMVVTLRVNPTTSEVWEVRAERAAAAVTSGVLVEVHPGANPAIVVQEGSALRRISITPQTTITRVNLSNDAGGSVNVRQLVPGDDVEVQLAPDNTAQIVRATFRPPLVARIQSVSPQARAIVLADGRTLSLSDRVRVLINEQPGTINEIPPGATARLRVNPSTNRVWEIRVDAPAAQPAPRGPAGFVILAHSDIAFPGRGNVFNGHIHTNASAFINGAGNAVNGTVEAAGEVRVTPGNTVRRVSERAARVPVPRFNVEAFRAVATTVVPGGTTLKGLVNVTGVMFGDGDLIIEGAVIGTGTLVVRGNLTIRTILAAAPTQVSLVAGRDLTIEGNGTLLRGVFYSGAGNLYVRGSNHRLEGMIVGDKVSLEGTGSIFTYRPEVGLPQPLTSQ
ncbi:MAG: copper amine oxidase N-terminal domain-containing protein [Armatimonadetes bacterium]|nr:copper amine oxidase N-terminal domain-containing protein [Armatimonadota bacterium]